MLKPGGPAGTGGGTAGADGMVGTDGVGPPAGAIGMLRTIYAALSLGLKFRLLDLSFMVFPDGAWGPDAGSRPSSQVPQLYTESV
jgi:hypothetical protein